MRLLRFFFVPLHGNNQIVMAKKKILFINQEIAPYVPDTNLSLMGRALPQAMQEKNHEIRTFMPKWGSRRSWASLLESGRVRAARRRARSRSALQSWRRQLQ